MLGGGAAPEGNHLFIGLHHPPGADTTRCKREANFQCWNACSTCHDGLLAVVTSASQGAVLSGAVPPETRHHSQVVVVCVAYSSRTLPNSWQLCRKCTHTALWRTLLRWVERMLLHVPGFQPLPQHPLVHRDMGEQPVVAYCVEAGRDVALQDPLSRSLPGKDDRALHHRIGGGSFLPEPVGVRVGSCLGDGVQGEQVEGLHRSIPHCRDAEGTLLAVTLRNEHPTQRSGAVPPLSQVEHCLHLLLRSVPPVAVHPWGVLPLIVRHALDGNGLAAVRVGQQVLQGFDLAPSAFLRCLHDTGLEPTHVVVGGRPGDGVPAFLGVGGGTSSRMVSGVPPLRRVCRHVLSLLSRFAKRSRDERPEGSRLACARDPVAWRLNPSPPRYRAAFASSILLYPQPLRFPLRCAFPCGETTGLPRSACVPRWVRPRLSAGGCPVCGRKAREPLHQPRTFWFKPVSIFGLSSVTAFISGSLPLVIPSALAPAPPDAGSRDPSSRSDHPPFG